MANIITNLLPSLLSSSEEDLKTYKSREEAWQTQWKEIQRVEELNKPHRGTHNNNYKRGVVSLNSRHGLSGWGEVGRVEETVQDSQLARMWARAAHNALNRNRNGDGNRNGNNQNGRNQPVNNNNHSNNNHHNNNRGRYIFFRREWIHFISI